MVKPWHSEARKMRQDGMTCSDIAAALGKSLTGVWNVVRDIPFQSARKKRHTARLEEIRRLRADNVTFADIGQRWGVTAQRVHAIVTRASA